MQEQDPNIKVDDPIWIVYTQHNKIVESVVTQIVTDHADFCSNHYDITIHGVKLMYRVTLLEDSPHQTKGAEIGFTYPHFPLYSLHPFTTKFAAVDFLVTSLEKSEHYLYDRLRKVQDEKEYAARLYSGNEYEFFKIRDSK